METISRYLLTFLLNSLWQAPLVAAVAALASRLMRNGPARHRHAVWVAALASSLLMPVLSMNKVSANQGSQPWVSPALPAAAGIDSQFDPNPHAAPTVRLSSAPAGASQRTTPPTPATRTVPFAAAAILLAAYALFFLFRLGQLALACIRTVQIRSSATPAAPSPLLQAVWTRSQDAIHIKGVELLGSDTVCGPVTAGAWRKTIILPEPLLAETSEDVLTTAIGHEMAHIARHDFALNLLYEAMYLPLAFHPAATLIRRGIERTRELACDELVTERLMDPRDYARSIMSIAASMTALPRPSHALGVFDGDILEERIKHLVNRRATNLPQARLLMAAALTALAVCIGIGSGLAVPARAQSGNTAEMKLAAAAYNTGDFKTAVQHFENAVQSDAADLKAKLFLANALLREHNVEEPGQTPGSPLIARARQQYAAVLAQDPANRPAMEGMLTITIGEKQFPEAHDWAVKIAQYDPQAKTAFYAAGFLDWSMVYPPVQLARRAAGMAPQDSNFIPDASVRKALRDQYLAPLEDGRRRLETAISLDPQYSDAMAYLNLIARLEANMAETQAESADLTAKANEWVDRAMSAKRNRPNPVKPAATQLDVNAPPLGVFSEAPPPPPPPPPPPSQAKIQQLATPAIPVSGAIQSAKLVKQVPPVYPAAAKEAGIEGTVDLAAIINPDGRIEDLRVSEGQPLLAAAAMQAVWQWVYQPTLLNGQPASVSTTIHVTFAKGQ